MNRTQYTVFGMLLAAAGLHIWLDSTARSAFKQFLSITPQNWKQIGSATLATYLLWFIALAAMLLIADYLPRVALMVSALILTGAVLINSDPIISWLNQAESALASTSQGGTQVAATQVD